MRYYVIDAFADELFRGNPAGVCLPGREIPDALMQKIAFENNLAETAFLWKTNEGWRLRWFTPEYEIDLCGHATLASAFVVMNYVDTASTQASFETQSGILTVKRNDDLYTMNFPSRMPAPIKVNPLLQQAFHCRVLEAHQARDLLVVVEDEAAVRDLTVDTGVLSGISRDVTFAVIVTAQGSSCDFVSRFITPNTGSKEDPVTGSAHSTLVPFWSRRLNKTKLVAKQLSERGGTLICEALGGRVAISGRAVCYLEGELKL